jgi:hypothetical protein
MAEDRIYQRIWFNSMDWMIILIIRFLCALMNSLKAGLKAATWQKD